MTEGTIFEGQSPLADQLALLLVQMMLIIVTWCVSATVVHRYLAFCGRFSVFLYSHTRHRPSFASYYSIVDFGRKECDVKLVRMTVGRPILLHFKV